MKALKITYWTSTLLFATLFTTTGTLYLLHFPTFVKRATDLFYPLYLLDIIGTAKVLGGIALVTPKFPRLKEWAYAGFAFDFIGAIWSHPKGPRAAVAEFNEVFARYGRAYR